MRNDSIHIILFILTTNMPIFGVVSTISDNGNNTRYHGSSRGYCRQTEWRDRMRPDSAAPEGSNPASPAMSAAQLDSHTAATTSAPAPPAAAPASRPKLNLQKRTVSYSCFMFAMCYKLQITVVQLQPSLLN